MVRAIHATSVSGGKYFDRRRVIDWWTPRGPPAPEPSENPVYTVGHSTRLLEEFFPLLGSFSIRCLVNVRTVPPSRRVPRFNQESLPQSLERLGIRDLHEPRLGGLRHRRAADSPNTDWRNESFAAYANHIGSAASREGLASVLRLRATGSVVSMCAEAVSWGCHRALIADSVLL